RHQHRCDRGAAPGAVDRAALGLAVGLPPDRRARAAVAGALAGAVPLTAGGSAGYSRRTGADRARPGGARRTRAPAPALSAGPVPWLGLLRRRQTWAVIAGKLLAVPIWWFYLYWLPKFLDARYGIKLARLALPLIVVYAIADLGSITGGWFSSALLKRGWTLNRARKTAMLTMALLIVPTAFAPLAPSLWAAVIIVGV